MQFDPGAGHDVRNAKGAANLDQFATGDDAFLARAQAVECQQYGCRIVVDHRDRLGAGQLTDQPFNQVIAVTALAGGQIVFKVQRIARGHLYCINGFLGQQRPPQVGVQYRTGKVEHPPYLAAMLDCKPFAGAPGKHCRSQFCTV
ncbi:hypothetical protein D3C72_1308240 [compost metagenome]